MPRIVALDGDAPEGATVIDGGGKCLAPGIVDWGVKIGEPGERHRESMRSAALAAAAGGVTTIIARPDTLPPIDAPEALAWGLVDRILPAPDLMEAARALATDALAADPAHVATIKAMTRPSRA